MKLHPNQNDKQKTKLIDWAISINIDYDFGSRKSSFQPSSYFDRCRRVMERARNRSLERAPWSVGYIGGAGVGGQRAKVAPWGSLQEETAGRGAEDVMCRGGRPWQGHIGCWLQEQRGAGSSCLPHGV